MAIESPVGHRCWCGRVLLAPNLFEMKCPDGHTTHTMADNPIVYCPSCKAQYGEEGEEGSK